MLLTMEEIKAQLRLDEDFDADAKILLLYGLMEQTLCEKVQETAQRCGTEFLKLPLQNPVQDKQSQQSSKSPLQQHSCL